MVFQKGQITFNARGTTLASFQSHNLAQTASHGGAGCLRAPGEPGQRVWRGMNDADTL
jgi:hypothetical protein